MGERGWKKRVDSGETRDGDTMEEAYFDACIYLQGGGGGRERGVTYRSSSRKNAQTLADADSHVGFYAVLN